MMAKESNHLETNSVIFYIFLRFRYWKSVLGRKDQTRDFGFYLYAKCHTFAHIWKNIPFLSMTIPFGRFLMFDFDISTNSTRYKTCYGSSCGRQDYNQRLHLSEPTLSLGFLFLILSSINFHKNKKGHVQIFRQK